MTDPKSEPSEATLLAMGHALFKSTQGDCDATLDELRPVFEFVRAAIVYEESEACAMVCESLQYAEHRTAWNCAEAIRARTKRAAIAPAPAQPEPPVVKESLTTAPPSLTDAQCDAIHNALDERLTREKYLMLTDARALIRAAAAGAG